MKKQNLCFRSGYSPDIATKGESIHRNESHERSHIERRLGEVTPGSAHLTDIGDLLGVLYGQPVSLVIVTADVNFFV